MVRFGEFFNPQVKFSQVWSLCQRRKNSPETQRCSHSNYTAYNSSEAERRGRGERKKIRENNQNEDSPIRQTGRVVDLFTRALIKQIKSKQREKEKQEERGQQKKSIIELFIHLSLYFLLSCSSEISTCSNAISHVIHNWRHATMTPNLNQSFFVHYSQHKQSNKLPKNT